MRGGAMIASSSRQFLEVPGNEVELQTVVSVDNDNGVLFNGHGVSVDEGLLMEAAPAPASEGRSVFRAAWRGLREHERTWSRFKLLGTFLIFYVCLPLADIVTDVLGGLSLYRNGHRHWACATWALIVAPAAAAFAVSGCAAVSRRSCNDRCIHNFCFGVSHLPFIQPFEMLLELLALDTDASENAKRVEEIRVEAAGLGFFEAFLEAGPQFILQLSIILRLGSITYAQMLSLPMSLVALSFAAAKAYYLQRLSPFADPDPSLTKNVLPVVPVFVVVTFCYGVSWAFILAYAKLYVFILVIAMIFLNVLALKAFSVERNLVLFKMKNKSDEVDAEDDGDVERDWKKLVDDEVARLKWKAVLTSVLTPCVVGHYKTNLLSISAFSTTLFMLMCLITLPIIAEHTDLQLEDEPPLSHCCVTESQSQINAVRQGRLFCSVKQTTMTSYQLDDCGRAIFQVCHDECLPRVRLCQNEESPLVVLSTMIVPGLGLSMILSLVLCMALNWLSDFANVFRLTNWLSCGRGFLHRSLLRSLVAEGNDQMLSDILKELKSDPTEAISRIDSEGDHLLHVACRNGFSKCTAVLIKHGTEVDVRNAMKQRPVHVAAQAGSLACLRRILEENEDISILDEDDGEGKIPLDYAIEQNNRRMARFLLQLNGQDPKFDTRLSRDSSAFSLACAFGSTRQIEAVLNFLRSRRPPAVEANLIEPNLKRRSGLFTKKGAGDEQILDYGWLDYCSDKNGRTGFHYVADREDSTKPLQLLLQFFQELGGKEWPVDNNGKTPFDLAVMRKNIWACKHILDYLKGESVTSTGQTSPVQTSPVPKSKLKQNRISTLSRLSAFLTDGKDAGRPFKKEGNLMHYALYIQCLRCFEVVLQASERHNWEELGQLWTPPDVERSPNYRSVLHVLIRKADIAFLEHALKHFKKKYKDDEIKDILDSELDSHGCPLLHTCAVRNKKEFAELLLNHGASVNNTSKGNGETPLHRAISRRSRETLNLLLEHGAHIRLKDGRGLTALHFAVLSGSGEMVQKVIKTTPETVETDAETRCVCHGKTPLDLLSDDEVPEHLNDLVYVKGETGERQFDKEGIYQVLFVAGLVRGPVDVRRVRMSIASSDDIDGTSDCGSVQQGSTSSRRSSRATLFVRDARSSSRDRLTKRTRKISSRERIKSFD